MISITCTHCGSRLRVPDAHAGKKGRCPSCKSVFAIPAVTVAEDDEPPAARRAARARPRPDAEARRRPVRAAAVDDDEEPYGDESDDRPARRSSLPLILGISIPAALIVIGGAAVGAYILFSQPKPATTRTASAPPGGGTPAAQAANAVPASDPVLDMLVGRWVSDDRGFKMTYEFAKDGTYTVTMGGGGRSATTRGTYKVIDANTLQMEGNGVTSKADMNLTADTLDLTIHATGTVTESKGEAANKLVVGSQESFDLKFHFKRATGSEGSDGGKGGQPAAGSGAGTEPSSPPERGRSTRPRRPSRPRP